MLVTKHDFGIEAITTGRIEKFKMFIICIERVYQIMHSSQILKSLINAFNSLYEVSRSDMLTAFRGKS